MGSFVLCCFPHYCLRQDLSLFLKLSDCQHKATQQARRTFACLLSMLKLQADISLPSFYVGAEDSPHACEASNSLPRPKSCFISKLSVSNVCGCQHSSGFSIPSHKITSHKKQGTASPSLVTGTTFTKIRFTLYFKFNY